jgi:hypothetical protein
MRFVFLSTMVLCGLAGSQASAATYYLDGAVGTSGNGQSWTTAWKSFSNISGLQPGDTVYISGGSTSQAYSLSSWTPTSGAPGSPITYAVGQDAGHNGIVSIASADFLSGNFHDVTINGNVSGAQHWQVTASGYIWEGSGNGGVNTNVTLRYISVLNMAGGFHWPYDNNTNVEIDHCSLVKDTDYANMHDFVFFGGGGTAASAFKVHDNYIQYPHQTTDHSLGDDMWIWANNVDFYNNTVKAANRNTYCSGTSCQHQDGFQNSLEKNVHIYNNTFVDPGESVYYEDSQNAGTVSSVLIYNNLIVRTYACNGVAQRVFDMNPENGGSYTVDYQNVVIANNTVVDQTSPCTFFLRFLAPKSYTNVYAVNNLQYPADAGISLDSSVSPGPTVSHNYAGNGISFVSYQQLGGPNNNLHLTSGDTAVIGQGMGLSTYFTTDKDGVLRGSAWDIGAYQYGGSTGGSSTAAPAPPTNLTALAQ